MCASVVESIVLIGVEFVYVCYSCFFLMIRRPPRSTLDRSSAASECITDYEVERISRGEYATLPNKTTKGRPSQFYFDRQIDPVINLWATPENSTDQLVYYYVRRIEDADALVNTTDMPFRFYPCMVAGLAYYLAMKRAPEKIQILKSVYEEEFQRAADEDEGRTPLKLQPSMAYLRV